MPDAERRLAAIVAIDVAGYSRLMGADEAGTLAALKAHREVTDPIGARHGGRMVGTAGDGALWEFPSVTEAVAAAVEVQALMAERNAGLPDDRKMLYRIGVNLGDVLVDGEEIYGDGVNVAARLEALAEPGGICVSSAAYEQVRDKLDIEFEDLGEVEVKNIARPVRAFRVASEGAAATARQPRPRRTSNATRISAVVFAILLAITLGLWATGRLAPPAQDSATADPVLELPEGPKIVVLPFDNLSGDAEQDYFVDGLTEDLTTRLTQHGYLFVIARNSAFKFKGQSPDVRDVGRDLGVDYVVEGSVRRAADTIRVSAQLLDARDGTHMWAETFDRTLDVDGVFGIQDELSAGISAAIGGTGGVRKPLMAKIAGKRPEDLASFECVLLSMQYWEAFLETQHARARDCLETAVKKDPAYALAWAELANLYRSEYIHRHNPRPDPLQRGMAAAKTAIAMDPNLNWAHQSHANLSFSMRRRDDALSSVERALKLAPNNPWQLAIGADILARLGQWERSILLAKKAAQFNPYPPAWTYWTIAHYHHQKAEYAEAYDYALLLKKHWGTWYWTTAWEAMMLAELGRTDEARAALHRALEQNPRLAAVARQELEIFWWSQPDYVERMLAALQKAGLEMPSSEEAAD